MGNDASDKKPEVGEPSVAAPRTSAASGGSAQAAPGPFGSMASAPVPSLPKAGGAIRGIGEKFAVNPSTGSWYQAEHHFDLRLELWNPDAAQ